MFGTVKQIINSTEDKDFDSFYSEYVLKIQDENLQRELMHSSLFSMSDLNSIDAELNKLYSEVKI